MTDLPTFGVRLDRLLKNRRADPSTVARAADVSVSQLEAVLAGAQADAALLRRLAPALGLRTADLFVIAGRDLPADLAPASGTRPWHVGQVMLSAMRLHGERFDRLHEFIRCMPERDPVAPLPLPRSPAGPGTLVGGLLANRNIRPHIAKLLYTISDGPIVSDSTVYRVIHGRSALTARYVTAFAAVLGIRVDDLAALTGVGPPVTTARLDPRGARLAALAWDARRLNNEQLSQVQHLAFDLARVGAAGEAPGRDTLHLEDRI